MDLKDAIESYLPSDKSKLNGRPPPGKKKKQPQNTLIGSRVHSQA